MNIEHRYKKLGVNKLTFNDIFNRAKSKNLVVSQCLDNTNVINKRPIEELTNFAVSTKRPNNARSPSLKKANLEAKRLNVRSRKVYKGLIRLGMASIAIIELKPSEFTYRACSLMGKVYTCTRVNDGSKSGKLLFLEALEELSSVCKTQDSLDKLKSLADAGDKDARQAIELMGTNEVAEDIEYTEVDIQA